MGRIELRKRIRLALSRVRFSNPDLPDSLSNGDIDGLIDCAARFFVSSMSVLSKVMSFAGFPEKEKQRILESDAVFDTVLSTFVFFLNKSADVFRKFFLESQVNKKKGGAKDGV